MHAGSRRTRAAVTTLEELVHHAADDLYIAARAPAHPLQDRGGHHLEGGQALAQQPPGFRVRQDRLDVAEPLLQALPSLAYPHPVAEREAHEHFHANHFLSGAGLITCRVVPGTV